MFILIVGITLLVAAMVIHGARSGAYSPIAPYGVVINQLATDLSISYSPLAVYMGTVGFHVALVLAVFFLLGGYQLRGQTFVANEKIEPGDAPDNSKLRYLTLQDSPPCSLPLLPYRFTLGSRH